mmetsp:Transcript_18902/g.72847  ORF Transcript_18902/g.72847 Transcript_18902/m.72847 type:complete len:204 (+) Transcript_18902:838-1449(+)
MCMRSSSMEERKSCSPSARLWLSIFRRSPRGEATMMSLVKKSAYSLTLCRVTCMPMQKPSFVLPWKVAFQSCGLAASAVRSRSSGRNSSWNFFCLCTCGLCSSARTSSTTWPAISCMGTSSSTLADVKPWSRVVASTCISSCRSSASCASSSRISSEIIICLRRVRFFFFSSKLLPFISSKGFSSRRRRATISCPLTCSCRSL